VKAAKPDRSYLRPWGLSQAGGSAPSGQAALAI
jgi:hypothetical protein